jgi:anti-anti-sigma factor
LTSSDDSCRVEEVDVIEAAWEHVAHRDGDVCTVSLSGELDMSAASDVTQALDREIRRSGTEAVRVDLSAVTFLDSSAIGVLVTAQRSAHAAARQFTVTGAHGHVRRVLDVTGVLSVLTGEQPPGR